MVNALIVWLLVSGTQGAQRGAVTTATLSASTVPAGTPVTISVTGRNPCGAVHIDWGDGTAITYPIVDLTANQTHTYQKPGKYAIVARGMGNCDGATTVHLRVDPSAARSPGRGQPSPTPDDAPQISSFTISIPAPVGSPVGVTAHGQGECRFRVDFGDGRSEEFTVPLPHTVRHVYSAPGTYTVRAAARPPCEGRHSVKMDVGRADPGSRLLGLKVAPNPAGIRDRVTLDLEGNGRCAVTVDFGDGDDRRVEASLPTRLTHTYTRAGAYEIFAWTQKPCTGEATASVRVRQRRR
jgi:plastocyanin